MLVLLVVAIVRGVMAEVECYKIQSGTVVLDYLDHVGCFDE